MEKYPQSPKVIIEDITAKSYVVPEKRVEIQQAVSYRIVSEQKFFEYGLTEIPILSVTSTSEYYSQKGNNYSPENLIDHKITTYWQEGEEDCGKGQSITFNFYEPVIVSGMQIKNGKATNTTDFYANNRLASCYLFGEEKLLVELTDKVETQYIIFENPIFDTQAEIVIESIFAGSNYNDTCISEIIFFVLCIL